MELKSFGNMYYLDENGDTLVYPKTQFRWEWQSQNSNRWYAFNYTNSVELEKKYQEGNKKQTVTLGGESGYELIVDKKMESSNIDNTESKIEFKELITLKNPKFTDVENREEYIIRRSLIQWFRRGGASYEIYDEKFNKDIENELYEKQDSKDITFNYNGVNIVEIKKEEDTIIDSGIIFDSKRGESGQKILIRTRVVWFLDNNELPDFMCKVLEDTYRKIDISMINIPLSDIYETLFEAVQKSIGNSVYGLDNNLLIKKEIDGWTLFFKGGGEEGNNPKFYRGYSTTYEVKPPYKMDFPPSPDAEEEEDDKQIEDSRPREVILRIQRDNEISKTVADREWVTEEWIIKKNQNRELSIIDKSKEVQETLTNRGSLEPIDVNEIRKIKEEITDSRGRKLIRENQKPINISLNWLNNRNMADTIISRVRKILYPGKYK